MDIIIKDVFIMDISIVYYHHVYNHLSGYHRLVTSTSALASVIPVIMAQYFTIIFCWGV